MIDAAGAWLRRKHREMFPGVPVEASLRAVGILPNKPDGTIKPERVYWTERAPDGSLFDRDVPPLSLDLLIEASETDEFILGSGGRAPAIPIYEGVKRVRKRDNSHWSRDRGPDGRFSR